MLRAGDTVAGLDCGGVNCGAVFGKKLRTAIDALELPDGPADEGRGRRRRMSWISG